MLNIDSVTHWKLAILPRENENSFLRLMEKNR